MGQKNDNSRALGNYPDTTSELASATTMRMTAAAAALRRGRRSRSARAEHDEDCCQYIQDNGAQYR